MPTNSGRSTTIEDSGFVTFSGDAIGYEDLQANISSQRLPASQAPNWTTYDFGLGGVAFGVLGFAVGELIDSNSQTSHTMLLNSVLEGHIHYTVPSNSAGDKFKFQLDVIAAGIGDPFSIPTGSPFTAEATLSGNEAGRHNYLDFGDIPAINSTVSSLYIMRLSRIAASSDEYTPRVYVLFKDSHYQRDTPAGSRAEGIK